MIDHFQTKLITSFSLKIQKAYFGVLFRPLVIFPKIWIFPQECAPSLLGTFNFQYCFSTISKFTCTVPFQSKFFDDTFLKHILYNLSNLSDHMFLTHAFMN